MQFTVEDVTKLDVMRRGRIRTAKNNVKHRPVRSISVIEIPVEDFIEENELVLSTGVGCGYDETLFQQFVEDVMNSRAAALAVATGRHIMKIPEKVIQIAEEAGFPIVEVPWEIRFRDIIKEVLNHLQDFRTSVLKESEIMQKDLLNLFIQERDLSVFVKVLEQKLKRPIIVTDREGKIKGKSAGCEKLAKHLGQRVPLMDQSLTWESLGNPGQFLSSISCANMEGETFIRVSVGFGSRIQGYLVVSIPSDVSPDTFLEPGNIHILTHAVPAASLWFQREEAVLETEMRLRGDFVWSLARGNFDSWDSVISQAKSLHYQLNVPYVSIIGYPENLHDLFTRQKSDSLSFHEWHERMIRNVEQQFILSAKKWNKHIMTTFQQNQFIIFLECAREHAHETIRQFLDRVEESLKQTYPELIISWGTGERSAGVNHFHESYHDARIALNIGRKQKGPGHRMSYANTALYRLMGQLAKNEQIREIALSTIGKLIEYDRKKEMDLIPTLATYIRYHRNVSKSARALNLHRQSLLYRLRKIESLTGVSLGDTDNFFLLDFSIKLWSAGIDQDSETV